MNPRCKQRKAQHCQRGSCKCSERRHRQQWGWGMCHQKSSRLGWCRIGHRQRLTHHEFGQWCWCSRFQPRDNAARWYHWVQTGCRNPPGYQPGGESSKDHTSKRNSQLPQNSLSQSKPGDRWLHHRWLWRQKAVQFETMRLWQHCPWQDQGR